jgi:hypothetical protein
MTVADAVVTKKNAAIAHTIVTFMIRCILSPPTSSLGYLLVAIVYLNSTGSSHSKGLRSTSPTISLNAPPDPSISGANPLAAASFNEADIKSLLLRRRFWNWKESQPRTGDLAFVPIRVTIIGMLITRCHGASRLFRR